LRLAGFANKQLNGWEVNSIVTWQSGFPFTVASGIDNSLTGVGSDRADFIGSGSAQLSDSRPLGEAILHWFDSSKFTKNAIGTFGNSGRNILRGPRFFNTDFGLVKGTSIHERMRLQFRAEFFNLFNNVNFMLPNANMSSAQVGQITSVIADSERIVRFGLELSF